MYLLGEVNGVTASQLSSAFERVIRSETKIFPSHGVKVSLYQADKKMVAEVEQGDRSLRIEVPTTSASDDIRISLTKGNEGTAKIMTANGQAFLTAGNWVENETSAGFSDDGHVVESLSNPRDIMEQRAEAISLIQTLQWVFD